MSTHPRSVAFQFERPFLHALNLNPSRTTATAASPPRIIDADYHARPVWELEPLDLPPNAFATLRSLTVTFQHVQSGKNLWSTPLVTNLTFARVLFDNWLDGDPLEVAQFFDILARSSLNLTAFSITALVGDTFFPTEFSVEILSNLSHLSLDSLQLNRIQLIPHNGDMFGYIAQWWPSLRALDLRDQVATFDDLAIISRSFPWLDYLYLQLESASPPGKDVTLPSVQHFSSHLTFQTHLRHVYSLPQPQQNDFALYLARLWKNVTCVHPRRYKDYKRFVARLNAQISEYSQAELA
ncbi:hypothetical protein BDV93DRAFT_514501 [Ceratobasidium sp. AG-I]|nr:hypothetical protein BDV93DRAFT_514501 [Ceratobasidium sp. AG-I]